MILVATHSVRPIHTSPTRNHTIKLNPRFRTIFCKSNEISDVKAAGLVTIKNDQRRICECFDLHKELVPYSEAWSWQKDIVRDKRVSISRNEECRDSLIVLQHHPVYTMGTCSSEEYLNFDLNDAPCDIYRTERGGEVTYHGPGQLVMYPIINLRNHKMDLHWYLRALEEVVIRVLSSTFHIKATRHDGLTGVWVGNQKLAAIGIKVSQWITFHGVALNVTTDLTPFRWIVPCGIRNRQVGSIKELLGQFQSDPGYGTNRRLIDVAYDALLKEFSEVFQLNLHLETIPTTLELMKNEKPISSNHANIL